VLVTIERAAVDQGVVERVVVVARAVEAGIDRLVARRPAPLSTVACATSARMAWCGCAGIAQHGRAVSKDPAWSAPTTRDSS
jgi:hypothetical protein